MLSSVLRRTASTSAARTALRAFSSSEPVVKVPLTTDSLEWTLSSPPPLHQFEEPPLMVETDHLSVSPGLSVEDALKAQSVEVSEVVGKEAWEEKDPKEFEGKIPQNAEWTEMAPAN
eukprot:CAMPEP_0178949598 /NCGR_PEP_ID=MMETSP0789-20121207/6144_1 /TAXON_ID=3005 /ORGANISM="Rhizosolenia setigera, Strain CCMP 1694" /LENGTH=116 /DNA_ID=CAMNT_0020630147 /DNA_START=42 /DNA_END=392 /DNA_ORIENTATION=+